MDAIELMMLEIAVRLAEEHQRVSVEIARRTLVDCWQSFSQEIGCGWGTERKQELGHPGAKCPEIVWLSLPSRILAASPHLQGYDAAGLPWDEIERLKRERGWNVIEALDYLGL